MAKILAVCVSTSRGTVKVPRDKIRLIENYGIEGDAHAGAWHRQVSLLDRSSVDKLREKLPDIPAGAFAENILTDGIILYELPVGTLLNIGSVQLEVTQIGKECHAACAIRKQVGDCVMPREGIFARVIKGGSVSSGDDITVEKR